MSDPRSVPAASSGRLAAAAAAPSRDAFHSSGQSPGDSPGRAPRLHLVGPGQVGRAFLEQLGDRAVRVVACSDSTGTTYSRDGLDTAAVLEHKRAGRPLRDLPGAESIPTELAIRVVAADVVVDATPSDEAAADAAVQRGNAALQIGAALVACSKVALARVAPRWLAAGTRQRVGLDAVLGGAGAALLRELDELRRDCQGLALVGNVTTTAIVTAIERGASLDEGIAEAQRLGYLEPDGHSDLDGSDAAKKLLVVFGAVFGESWQHPPALAAVQREHVRALDPDVLRERAARGATTRLVARADRLGRALSVAFEELPLGAPLAAPPDRVVYGYQLPQGLRVHTGLGVGYQRTAEALWGDVDRLLAVAAQEVSR
ncbi:MAG: hypothetical protein H6835_11905 [Planctomycetes bacterium]|nr:hypothetical protein [Planctomycetota bacterium]